MTNRVVIISFFFVRSGNANDDPHRPINVLSSKICEWEFETHPPPLGLVSCPMGRRSGMVRNTGRKMCVKL
ncbi:hypothetical protein CDAR_615271 [Caerostris darwini]|uniref:Secreted protein n=1 Tax=Caerostris darwini TaxID=1538125 RepID=A0AAV4RT94_9ARAC|nr:hypothetical protein CDAR_615271 [Caerostris darwini]